jgi:hypothetical protein
VIGDRRLRDVQAAGGSGHAAGAYHGVEDAQLDQVHGIANTSLKAMLEIISNNLSDEWAGPRIPRTQEPPASWHHPLLEGVATMLPELATRVGVCYVGAIMILAGLMHFVA